MNIQLPAESRLRPRGPGVIVEPILSGKNLPYTLVILCGPTENMVVTNWALVPLAYKGGVPPVSRPAANLNRIASVSGFPWRDSSARKRHHDDGQTDELLFPNER